MKIGIVTYWSSDDNYGQQMQCWALQSYLKKNGHEPFLIRYSIIPPRPTLVRRILGKLNPLKYMKYFIPGFREKRNFKKKEKILFEKNRKINVQRGFEEFRKAQLCQTDRIYSTLEEIQKEAPMADVYITGSDQVWYDSVKNKDNEIKYLNFGPSSVRRISYAASIGREILASEKKRFAELLSSLDAVSVREFSALEQCVKVGRKDTIVTLDPTLLLTKEDFLKLCLDVKEVDSSYLFVYVLNVLTPEEIRSEEILFYAKKRQLKIRSVSSSGYYQAREFFLNIKNEQLTIPEWIVAIRDAQCMVTSSFHGMVFCIILHCPFVVIPLQGERAKSNSRVYSLLDAIGLTDRVLENDKALEDIIDMPIDWDLVDERLKKYRKDSEDFLLSNIR